MGKLIRIFAAIIMAVAATSCRTIVDPPEPQPSCVIPVADSFHTTDIKYSGGIRMFTVAGEVTNATVLSGFIAAHPFFSAAPFSESYIPVKLTFSPGNKAVFTSAFSTTHFDAQCDGQSILMQSADTSVFVMTDTSRIAIHAQLFYPASLYYYTPLPQSTGVKYQVRIVPKVLLSPNSVDLYAEVNRYYYNIQNRGSEQMTDFSVAVIPVTIPLATGDTIVFQTGRLTYHKL